MTKYEARFIYNGPIADPSLARLSDIYREDAKGLEKYIEELKEKIKARPDPDELYDLEKRLELMRRERRELLNTALKLSRLAAPPAEHPSLLHKGA